jgi:excisionase family DNA binding protein
MKVVVEQGRQVTDEPAVASVAGGDEQVLTYREAAQVLKVSARTLERWTREGLVPYIRLPQRGRWSGVRFSRNQLLRWLRQRTVRER